MLAIALELLSLLVYPLNLSLLLALIGLVVWRLGWARSAFYILLLAFGWYFPQRRVIGNAPRDVSRDELRGIFRGAMKYW